MRIDEIPIAEIAIDENEIKQYERKLLNEKCTFLVVGRIIYRKGHEFLLDALSGIPSNFDYTCRIIGAGPDLSKLKRRCSQDEYLSKHVEIVGIVPYIEMEQEYKKADVLIMPSIRETTGTVLLEAMSKGLPIITIGKFGGGLLVDNDTGWLFQGVDKMSYIENLRQVIIETIKRPDEVTHRGNNARKKTKRYTWKEKNEYYQKIYCELLDE